MALAGSQLKSWRNIRYRIQRRADTQVTIPPVATVPQPYGPACRWAFFFARFLLGVSAMAEEDLDDRSLPIELSSLVSTLETLTHELTKNLTERESRQVITNLCERLARAPNDQRSPDRPFSNRR